MLEDNEEYLSQEDPEDLVRRQRRPFRPLALVNPRLKPVGRSGARFFEGCLSVPGYQVRVTPLRVCKPSAIVNISAVAHLSAPQPHAPRTGEGCAQRTRHAICLRIVLTLLYAQWP